MSLGTTITIEPSASMPRKKRGDNEGRSYEPASGSATGGTGRISVALDENGRLDMSRLRGDTKERLKAALSDPNIQAELLGHEPEPLFSDNDVATLFAGLSQLEQLVAKVAFKIPNDIAAEAFVYSSDDLAALTPPTQGLLARYSPTWLSANKDLVAFTLIFVGVTRRQFDTAMTAAIARKASSAKHVGPEIVQDSGMTQ